MSALRTSLNRKFKASAFVRRNSGKVAAELPHNELAQFLHKSEENKAAMEDIESVHNSTFPTHYLDAGAPDSWEAKLSDECLKLKTTWQSFQMNYTEFQNLDVGGPPSVEDLQSIMETTVQNWNSRCDSGLGRAKENFLNFSGTLLQFSDLFSIIPSGDKYISLLTGVISTTVKAAGRRTDIAEGFSSALAEIGRAMCLGTDILNVHRNSDDIKRLVVLLYIRYSNFFCHFMTWHLGSKWDRVATALRNDYYTSEVKPHVTEISRICRDIESHARLIAQRQINDTGELVQSLNQRVEIGFEQVYCDGLKWKEHLDERLREFKQLLLGQHSHRNVAAMAEHHMYDADLATATCTGQHNATNTEEVGRPLSQPLKGPGSIDQPNASSSLVPSDTHTRDTLERTSLNLLKYLPVTDPGADNTDGSHPGTRIVPGMIVSRLGEWAGSPKSEVLWIIGVAFSNVNYANLAALHIRNMAKVADIRCISVFCTPLAKFSDAVDEKQSREMNMLTTALYTLIHRLVEIANETLVDTRQLEAMISSLNGRKESKTTHTALEAIRILLTHRSPLLLIVLGGLDQVESRETEPYLRELVEMLCADATSVSRLKVLLASEGYLRSCSGLKPEECLDCAFLPGSRPGQALPGGRFVNEIDGGVFDISY